MACMSQRYVLKLLYTVRRTSFSHHIILDVTPMARVIYVVLVIESACDRRSRDARPLSHCLWMDLATRRTGCAIASTSNKVCTNEFDIYAEYLALNTI